MVHCTGARERNLRTSARELDLLSRCSPPPPLLALALPFRRLPRRCRCFDRHRCSHRQRAASRFHTPLAFFAADAVFRCRISDGFFSSHALLAWLFSSTALTAAAPFRCLRRRSAPRSRRAFARLGCAVCVCAFVHEPNLASACYLKNLKMFHARKFRYWVRITTVSSDRLGDHASGRR